MIIRSINLICTIASAFIVLSNDTTSKAKEQKDDFEIVSLLFFKNEWDGGDHRFVDYGLIILNSPQSQNDIYSLMQDKKALFNFFNNSRPILLEPVCTDWKLKYDDVEEIIKFVENNSNVFLEVYDRKTNIKSTLIMTNLVKVRYQPFKEEGKNYNLLRLYDSHGYIWAETCYNGVILTDFESVK